MLNGRTMEARLKPSTPFNCAFIESWMRAGLLWPVTISIQWNSACAWTRNSHVHFPVVWRRAAAMKTNSLIFNITISNFIGNCLLSQSATRLSFSARFPRSVCGALDIVRMCDAWSCGSKARCRVVTRREGNAHRISSLRFQLLYTFV